MEYQKRSESAKLDRKPSIENEPKTLLREEMNLAREAALKVINSETKEKALQIFLEGKKPVGTGVERNCEFKPGTDEE